MAPCRQWGAVVVSSEWRGLHVGCSDPTGLRRRWRRPPSAGAAGHADGKSRPPATRSRRLRPPAACRHPARLSTSPTPSAPAPVLDHPSVPSAPLLPRGPPRARAISAVRARAARSLIASAPPVTSPPARLLQRPAPRCLPQRPAPLSAASAAPSPGRRLVARRPRARRRHRPSQNTRTGRHDRRRPPPPSPAVVAPHSHHHHHDGLVHLQHQQQQQQQQRPRPAPPSAVRRLFSACVATARRRVSLPPT